MEKLKNIKCYLLDMDGTIYLGNELIDGAKEFLEKLKEDQAKHTKWVMGEKIVFDEGKQRVKQQENVDIQRTIPLPIYIGKRGIYETI